VDVQQIHETDGQNQRKQHDNKGTTKEQKGNNHCKNQL
jgi:hypothetical protein